MSRTVPTPVSAVLGIVPTVLGGVRRLPGKAVQLPILALGSALNGMALARREYDGLSERGERLVAKLRGESEELPTPVARPPKGAPTAKATEPDATRVDTAASPAVVAAVAKVAEQVTINLDATAADLPLADYDHLTLGALRGRLRSLEVDQLVQLRAYEKSKAARLPVVTMLDNRIAKLAAGQAQPSPGTAAESQVPSATTAQPPKKIGTTARPKNDALPHTKVRKT